MLKCFERLKILQRLLRSAGSALRHPTDPYAKKKWCGTPLAIVVI
jgi:hypothetical protein